MAKIKYSGLVSEMRNKLNGSVLSKNRYGNYMRNKVTPVNPQTADQVAQRAKLATFSQAWRGLTEDQRKAWLEAVDNWKRTDIFGDIVKPTGNTLYNRINMTLATAGAAPLNLPPLPAGVESPGSVSAVIDVAASEILLDWTPTNVPANTVLVVEATQSLSAGINNANNLFRIITTLPAATASGEDVFAQYVAKFGTPTVGMKIHFRIFFINILTGEKSQMQKTATIVA